MRTNLYMFRHNHKLSQSKMAEKCGVSRVTYGKIENGERSGSADFWRTLQKAFGVPDEEMWNLQKIEEGDD